MSVPPVYHSLGLTGVCETAEGHLLAFEGVIFEVFAGAIDTHLAVEDVLTLTHQAVYRSIDGGLTWSMLYDRYDLMDYWSGFRPEPVELGCEPEPASSSGVWEVSGRDERFRLVRNEGIYRLTSEDTAVREFDLSYYQRQARSAIPFNGCLVGYDDIGNLDILLTMKVVDSPLLAAASQVSGVDIKDYGAPSGGLVHSQTGNLIVLTHRDGVLVRSPEGVWQWASVGACANIATEHPRTIAKLLTPTLLLLVPLISMYSGIRERHISGFGWFRLISMAMIWSPIVVLVRIIPSAYTYSHWPESIDFWPQVFLLLGAALGFFLFAIMFLWSCLLVMVNLIDVNPVDLPIDLKKRAHWRLGVVLGAALLPYVLWVFGVIPDYGVAAIISVFAAFWMLYRVHQQVISANRP